MKNEKYEQYNLNYEIKEQKLNGIMNSRTQNPESAVMTSLPFTTQC